MEINCTGNVLAVETPDCYKFFRNIEREEAACCKVLVSGKYFGFCTLVRLLEVYAQLSTTVRKRSSKRMMHGAFRKTAFSLRNQKAISYVRWKKRAVRGGNPYSCRCLRRRDSDALGLRCVQNLRHTKQLYPDLCGPEWATALSLGFSGHSEASGRIAADRFRAAGPRIIPRAEVYKYRARPPGPTERRPRDQPKDQSLQSPLQHQTSISTFRIPT